MPYLQIYLILLRFVGQNRPQFRASTIEDPNQVKDLVDRLEKYQTPGSEDSIPFVRMELARFVLKYFEMKEHVIVIVSQFSSGNHVPFLTSILITLEAPPTLVSYEFTPLMTFLLLALI